MYICAKMYIYVIFIVSGLVSNLHQNTSVDRLYFVSHKEFTQKTSGHIDLLCIHCKKI